MNYFMKNLFGIDKSTYFALCLKLSLIHIDAADD